MKDLTKLLNCWSAGKFLGCGNLGTDGTYIYSYSEPIASRIQEGEHVGEFLVLINGAFSQTTSKHCGAIARALRGKVHRVGQDSVKCRSLVVTTEGLEAYERKRM